MKRIFAILLALALCFTIAACGGKANPDGGKANPDGSSSPAPGGSNSPAPPTTTPGGGALSPGDVIEAPKGDDVKFADLIDMISDVNFSVIDPHNPGGSMIGVRQVYSCIFNQLIKRTPDFEFVPELATSWESDDLQTWIFKLRDDVYFHNGDKFNAQSVIGTVNSARENPGTIGFDSWRSVDTITAIDDYTVKMVLTAPNVDFIYYLSLRGGSIVNYEARKADPVKGTWVGTGAYYVEMFDPADHVLLTRNDNYWGEPAITRQLIFRFVPEYAARTIMLLNGESHLCLNVSTEDTQMFIDHPDFIAYTIVSNAPQALGFSMTDPILSDRNFRLAVAHALNIADLAEVAGGKWSPPVTDGTYWGYATEFRHNDLPQRKYDPELAKKYLAESSYDGRPIEIIAGVDTTHRAAELMQEQLGKIGINITLFLTDVPTLSGLAVFGSDKVQLVHHTFAFNNSAASARSMLYTGGAGNRITYDNAAVRELIDKAPTISDPKEREAIYRQIQEMVYEDIPAINIFYRVMAIIANGGIGGLIVDRDQYHDFSHIFMVVD